MNQETEKRVSRSKVKGNYFTISYKPKRLSFSNIKGIMQTKNRPDRGSYNTAALAVKTPFVPKVNF